MVKSQPSTPIAFLVRRTAHRARGQACRNRYRKAFALLAVFLPSRARVTAGTRSRLCSGLITTRPAPGVRSAAPCRLLNTAWPASNWRSPETVGLAPAALNSLSNVYEFDKRVMDCQTHGHPPAETCPRCITPLSEATALCRDDFMAGFTLRNCPASTNGSFFETETLRRRPPSRSKSCCGITAYNANTMLRPVYARRWLALDPLTSRRTAI